MESNKLVLPEKTLKERSPRAQDRKVDAATAGELGAINGAGSFAAAKEVRDAFTAILVGRSTTLDAGFPVMAKTGEDDATKMRGVGLYHGPKAYVDGPDIKHQTAAERERGATERAELASSELALIIISALRADESFIKNATSTVRERDRRLAQITALPPHESALPLDPDTKARMAAAADPKSTITHTVKIPTDAITFMGGLEDDPNRSFSFLASDDVNKKTGELRSEKDDGRQAWLKQVLILTHAKVKTALLEQLRITGKFRRRAKEKGDLPGRGTGKWEDDKNHHGEEIKLPWGNDNVHPKGTSTEGTKLMPRSITMTFKNNRSKWHGDLECELDIFFNNWLAGSYGNIETAEWASLDPESLAQSFVVPQSVTEGRPARRTDIGVDKVTYEALRDVPASITEIGIETKGKTTKTLYPHRGYEKAFLAESVKVLPDAELDVSGRERMERESDKIAAFVKNALEANTSLAVQDAVKACLFQNPRSCDIFVEGPGRQDPRSRWPYEMLDRVKVKLGTSLGKKMDVKALINTWL